MLAEAGLLDGRRATTHWAHTALMQRRYPAVRVDPGVLYVDDTDVLTSAGKAAGMDLCLHLVRQDHGTAVANTLARTLVVPPHRPGGQAQFIPAAVAHGAGHVLGDVLPWALDRLDRPTTVRDLAREARMSCAATSAGSSAYPRKPIAAPSAPVRTTGPGRRSGSPAGRRPG
ncbi:hypothetical protein Aco04nite_87170 [Winogradskya consettensis]|uniref:Uncharacterized protein n=1 Tax=Winogradskya consettensis TaxID=113560 RepID=A0A919T3N6_9ACTN|nr:hypothetical protein Aco04nite_87170 [Actinoplanes consettensis]